MNSTCPELTWTGRRFACGLLLKAETAKAKRQIIESLGVGQGCPHAESPKRIARARRLGINEVFETR